MGLIFETDCPKQASMISSFRDVVELWGPGTKGADALAAEIGAGVWATRKWSHRRTIPPEWWVSILRTEVAQKAGLTADQLAALAARSPAEARA